LTDLGRKICLCAQYAYREADLLERRDTVPLSEATVFPIITRMGPGSPACASRSASSAMDAVTTA
jgi:hypothetical protein